MIKKANNKTSHKRFELRMRVPTTNTMVMWHKLSNGFEEQRCPFCFSRKMRILDYDVAEGSEKRFGDYRFIKKCLKCNGVFKVLVCVYENGDFMRGHGGETDVRETV